jgi:hypothetical protein
MPELTDRGLLPCILPCTSFTVHYDYRTTDEPPQDWVDSDVSRIMGLAADTIAAELLRDRVEFVHRGPEVDRLKLALRKFTGFGKWSWRLHAMRPTGPLSETWLSMADVSFTPGVTERVDALINRAFDIAADVSRASSVGSPNPVKYTTSWSNISNHQKIDLDARLRLPVDELIGPR